MDPSKMLQQALEAQQKLMDDLAAKTVEGTAGGGKVVVKATGVGKITEITISPEVIDPKDPEFLADLVLAAVNQALESANSLGQAQASDLIGGLGLPGL